MNHIHRNKGYKPEMLADGPVRELITATCDTLTEPLHNIGLRQEVPPELTAAINENTFYFSGFKTHHELVEASRLLKGDDGNFKPFEQFRRDVEVIDSTYNRNYLQAEYNFAAAASQMAVKWKEWEQDGDDYDLQYRTAGDDRVREEHAALDGITLPPSDPFWNSYLPPNGWNCRCTTVQVRKGKYPQSNPEEAAARGAACTARPKQQIFRFNPGKQQKIFPPKHPYFPKGCGNCQYKQLDYNPSSTQCQACRAILQNMEKEIKRREENRKEYERLKKDSDYTKVEYDEASGGIKATHKEHTFDQNTGWYETTVQDVGMKNGHTVVLEREIHTIYKKRNTEGRWDGEPFEIAGKETATPNNIRDGLKHCAKKPNCKVAVLFFPKNNFDLSNFYTGLNMYNGLRNDPHQWCRFNKIICIQGGEIIYEKSHIE